MENKPRNRPQQKPEKSRHIIESVGGPPVAILGMRGYFRDSMGAPGVNDRGLYDDAIFIVTPTEHYTFNANTDPSRYRKGHGTAEATKGMAELSTGIWQYRRGMHRSSYMALIQADEVVVIRDGNPNYADKGWFGINIHKGGFGTTSSLGCQTIHPEQWREFFDTVTRVMTQHQLRTISYVLVEGQG